MTYKVSEAFTLIENQYKEWLKKEDKPQEIYIKIHENKKTEKGSYLLNFDFKVVFNSQTWTNPDALGNNRFFKHQTINVSTDDNRIQNLFDECLIKDTNKKLYLFSQYQNAENAFDLRYFYSENSLNSFLQKEESQHLLHKNAVQNPHEPIKLNLSVLNENESKRFLTQNENFKAILEYIPEQVKKFVVPKITQQKIQHPHFQGKTSHFDIVNYTTKSICFDEAFFLWIDGKIPIIDSPHPIKMHYSPDNCQIGIFEYLNLIYIYSKDIPDSHKPLDSTKIEATCFNNNLKLYQMPTNFNIETLLTNIPLYMIENLKKKFPKQTIDPIEIKLKKMKPFWKPADSALQYMEHVVLCTVMYQNKTYYIQTLDGIHFTQGTATKKAIDAFKDNIDFPQYTEELLNEFITQLSTKLNKKISISDIYIERFEKQRPLSAYYDPSYRWQPNMKKEPNTSEVTYHMSITYENSTYPLTVKK